MEIGAVQVITAPQGQAGIPAARDSADRPDGFDTVLGRLIDGDAGNTAVKKADAGDGKAGKKADGSKTDTQKPEDTGTQPAQPDTGAAAMLVLPAALLANAATQVMAKSAQAPAADDSAAANDRGAAGAAGTADSGTTAGCVPATGGGSARMATRMAIPVPEQTGGLGRAPVQDSTAPADGKTVPGKNAAALKPETTADAEASPQTAPPEVEVSVRTVESSRQASKPSVQTTVSDGAAQPLRLAVQTAGRTAVSRIPVQQTDDGSARGRGGATEADTPSGNEAANIQTDGSKADGKQAAVLSAGPSAAENSQRRGPSNAVGSAQGATAAASTAGTASTGGSGTVHAQAVSPVQQTASAAAQAVRTGKTSLRLHLSPEGLGDVTVRLWGGADGVVMRITAENADTGRLLAGSVHDLTHCMRSEGVIVQKAEISYGGSGSDGGQQQASGDGSPWQGYTPPRENSSKTDAEQTFAAVAPARETETGARPALRPVRPGGISVLA